MVDPRALKIGDRVIIDGDRSLVATLTAILIRGHLGNITQFEVSYFHNGDSKSAWVENYRVTKVGDNG